MADITGPICGPVYHVCKTCVDKDEEHLQLDDDYDEV